MKERETQQAPLDPPNPSIAPLSAEEIGRIDAYWRACNYLSAGMIYLHDNPLLRRPLAPDQIKRRLLGHWGSDPGQSFLWVHLNRVIKKFDLDMIYISGPGHGAPATLSNAYLEGTYSEIYPDKSRDEAGMRRFFRQSPFPAASAATAPRKHPARFMRVGSWDTASLMASARPSTIPT